MTQKFHLAGLAIIAFAVFAAMTVLSFPKSIQASEEDTVVFLVRHAEKTDEERDPPLSDAGNQRAAELARVLRDAGVKHIHSTDYIRTRDTAAPLAGLLGLEIRIYDPLEPEALTAQLQREGGRHLVVGHSDTTPILVEKLGGEPGSAIDEAGEYDRLYLVTIGPDGQAQSVLLRYGQL